MGSEKILIVEDEEKIASIIWDYLAQNGFSYKWINNGSLVVSHVKRHPPDLILLDLMLPGKQGTEICREIRKFSEVPIIMITAKVDEVDRLIGLELGADDYICKPFSPREVIARIKSVFRRVQPKRQDGLLIIEPITLNSDTWEVSIDGQKLDLTPSEFGLLHILMQHPNKVFSREELISRVLGHDFEGYDRTIDTHVKNLRKKIDRYLPDREIIRSVYGVGYRFSE